MKKIFIGSVIFFIIALAALGYVVFIKKSPPASSSQAVNNANGTLPFGTPSGPGSNPQGQNASSEDATGGPGNQGLAAVRLMQLSNSPVAGATSFIIGSSTLVRYAAKGTGYITEVNLTAGTTSELVNTTFSEIYESPWANNGKTLIMRSADESDVNTITSYSAALEPSYNDTIASSSQPSYELLGTYLPSNIESIAVSPDTKKIVYAVSASGNGEDIQTSNPDGTKASTVLDSSFGEWALAWPQQSTIALTTKPAAGVPGNMYFVSLKTGLMKKVLGNIPGLVGVVDPKADHIAYTNDALALQIAAVGGATVNTDLQTVADKCAWANTSTSLYCGIPVSLPSGNFPDSWYQGSASFSDAIYQINGTTGLASVVGDLQNSYGQSLDVMDPFLTPDDQYLIFINKKDYTLWSLKISNS